MKKGLLIAAILVLLCALPMIAFALECPSGHNLDYVTPTKLYIHQTVATHSVKLHWDCPVCGRSVEKLYATDKHKFSGDHCKLCGASRPGKDTLRASAVSRGYDVVGRELFVLWKGSVYDSVNGSKLLTVKPLEQYYVNDYRLVGGTPWIQVSSTKRTDRPIGWMKAEIASINETPAVIEESFLIGRTVKIIVTSGKGRPSPGTQQHEIAYVHYGDYYEILDVGTASNGTQWYKIRVGNTACWISSGLCELW